MIGIVASRLVERYARPVVLIAGTDGDWKGSGRSIAGFDLHDGLRQCAGHLERWGGHAAAAGLSIKPENVPAFTEAFAAVGDGALADDDLRPPTLVDALVHGPELTLELCEELAQAGALRPRQPERDAVARRAASWRTSRRSARASTSSSACARTAATRAARSPSGSGGSSTACAGSGHYDVAFKLEANQWNGTVAPQLNVRYVFDADERYVARREWLKAEWRKEARDPAPRRSSPSSASPQGGARRHLLESERFVALLAEPELARAA